MWCVSYEETGRRAPLYQYAKACGMGVRRWPLHDKAVDDMPQDARRER